MAHVTRDMHDACLTAFLALKAADPAAYTRALDRRHPPARGMPDYDLMLDLRALDSVAAGWAGSMSVAQRDMARAASVLARGLAAA